jgi:hypothetical protein
VFDFFLDSDDAGVKDYEVEPTLIDFIIND